MNLEFIVQAMGAMNRKSEEKYYTIVKEVDEINEEGLVPTRFIMVVQLVCAKTVIYEKKYPILKTEKNLEKIVIGICARTISDCIGSGIINYRLAQDALTESYGQEMLGQDRISLIRRVIKYPATSLVGLKFRWLHIGKWDIEPMLDCTYEDLIKCLNELQVEFPHHLQV